MKDIVARVHVASHPLVRLIAKMLHGLDLAEQTEEKYESMLANMQKLREGKLANLRKHADEFGVTNEAGEIIEGYEVQLREVEEQTKMTLDEVRDKKQILISYNISLDALGTSLLQMARQLISIIRGGVDKCPPGRIVGPLCIRDIICNARTQSIHYEGGITNKDVIACFAALEESFGQKFQINQTPPKNLAAQVIKLLDWQDILMFESDMRSLVVQRGLPFA